MSLAKAKNVIERGSGGEARTKMFKHSGQGKKRKKHSKKN
jgi:hypothetical protein